MNQKNRKTKRTVWLMLLVMFFVLLAPVKGAGAQEKFKLSKTKLTLYQGNTYQLEYSGVQEPDPDDWWGYYYKVYFSSSDTKVAVVSEDGLVRGVGVGTATITAQYGEQEATCKVTVKANSCKLDKTDIVLYQEQETAVKLTGKKTAKDYSYYLNGAEDGKYVPNYALSIYSEGDGNFTMTAHMVGKYYVDFVINATDGKEYSARCTVEVLPCGLPSHWIAVAQGEEKQIVLENATLLSAGSDPSYYGYSDEDDGWYDDEPEEDGEWNVYDHKGKATVDENGLITGQEPGLVNNWTVRYKTAYGEERKQSLYVHVTCPEYVPFEGNLWVDDLCYWPEFKGLSEYSEVTVSVDDESVIETQHWSSEKYPSLYPRKGGTATLTFTADGVVFKQKVTVVNPQLSADSMLLEAGKKKTLKVTGAPEGSKITFKSSDKSVATVTKAGKITTKKAGSALITATVDGRDLYCSVSVGSGKAIKAVQKAEAVLGAEYSQDKRMQKGYYDCSSLVWRSYNEAGVKLAGTTYAPTAAELAKKLEAQGKVIAYEYVPADELLPGDIIFYAGDSNGRYKNIDHTAIFYGAYYMRSGWWDDAEIYNAGSIIHAVSIGVSWATYGSYDGYGSEAIVMIARPMK